MQTYLNSLFVGLYWWGGIACRGTKAEAVPSGWPSFIAPRLSTLAEYKVQASCM